MRIPFTIALSHRSRRLIYENIAFAIVFNTVMVLLSALGWLPMVWGAILHQVSSLGVILNSMRCRVKE
jgi:cation transport ATPase